MVDRNYYKLFAVSSKPTSAGKKVASSQPLKGTSNMVVINELAHEKGVLLRSICERITKTAHKQWKERIYFYFPGSETWVLAVCSCDLAAQSGRWFVEDEKWVAINNDLLAFLLVEGCLRCLLSEIVKVFVCSMDEEGRVGGSRTGDRILVPGREILLVPGVPEVVNAGPGVTKMARVHKFPGNQNASQGLKPLA